MRAMLSALAITTLAMTAVAADLNDLVEALGQPRSAPEAVAQNTSIVLYAADLCGIGDRVRRYKLDQAKVIQRLMTEGFGADRELETKRIVKEIDVWWSRTDVTDPAKRQLCEMAETSLKQLGY